MNGEVGDRDAPKLYIEGVGISVRPEVILRGKDKTGGDIVGAMKLYFCKSHPLKQDAAQCVATVLQQHVIHHIADGASVPLQRCAVLDVFAGATTTAPRAVTRLRRNIDAACEEIRLKWDVA
jgi:hypothetical protein